MALLTDEPVEVEALSKDVTFAPREDGRNVTTWSLVEKNLLTPSSRSAVTSSSARPTSPIGTAHFRRCWRASPSGSCCFSQGGSRLSLEALRGLVAELLVMTRELAPERGLPTVVGH